MFLSAVRYASVKFLVTAAGDAVMRSRSWSWLAALGIGIAVAGWASSFSVACPFCSAPSLTMTEQLSQSNAALLVKWSGGTPAKDQDGGFTEYEVVEVVSQPTGSKLAKGA